MLSKEQSFNLHEFAQNYANSYLWQCQDTLKGLLDQIVGIYWTDAQEKSFRAFLDLYKNKNIWQIENSLFGMVSNVESMRIEEEVGMISEFKE